VRIYKPVYQDEVFNFVENYYQRVDSINGFDIYRLISDKIQPQY